MFLIATLLGLAGAAFYFLHDPEALGDAAAIRQSTKKSRYRAIRIVPASPACQAARAAAKHRVLLSAAPRLPLEHCDRILICQCRYKHYADRRQGDDRRQLFGSLSQDALLGPVNRRRGADRRKPQRLHVDSVHY